MTIDNTKFIEIKNFRQSKDRWRGWYGYGTTAYDTAVGLGIGIAIATVMSSFGFHIELLPTYVLIALFGMIYFVSNLTRRHREYSEEQYKEDKLSEVITEEHINFWQKRLNKLASFLPQNDPLRESLATNVYDRTINDILLDTQHRYRMIHERLQQILHLPINNNPRQAAAIETAKQHAQMLIDKLKKRITWLAESSENQTTKNILRGMINLPLLEKKIQEETGWFRRGGDFLVNYNQSLFYSSCTILYIYGEFFAHSTLAAMMPWGAFVIISVAIASSLFGYFLDSIPLARENFLKKVKKTRDQLKDKKRLIEFSIDCCDELYKLNSVDQQLAQCNVALHHLPNHSNNHSLDRIASAEADKTPLKYIELDRVNHHPWMAKYKLDTSIELILALYSGFGMGAFMYALLPATLAILPGISLAMSVCLGIYYTLFRYRDIKNSKSKEAKMLESLDLTIKDSKKAIWKNTAKQLSLQFFDPNNKPIHVIEYITQSKLKNILNDLSNEYYQCQTNQQKVVNLAPRYQSDPSINQHYSLYQANTRALLDKLKQQLGLQFHRIKNINIQSEAFQLVNQRAPKEKSPHTLWGKAKKHYRAFTDFMENTYQDFLDGATMGTSIMATYFIGSGYFSIMTIGVSALWLTSTFIGFGLAYLLIKRMVSDSIQGYQAVIKDVKHDIKTKSILMDCLLIQKNISLQLDQEKQQFMNQVSQLTAPVMQDVIPSKGTDYTNGINLIPGLVDILSASYNQRYSPMPKEQIINEPVQNSILINN